MSDFDKQVGKRLQMARKQAGKSIVYGGHMSQANAQYRLRIYLF